MTQRGFSLVELLIVMALMGLVLSLVGPLGMKQIERSEAVYESMQLQQLLNRAAQQAYVQAKPVELQLDGKQLLGSDGQHVLLNQSFSHIFFPRQLVQINRNGFASQPQISALVRGQPRTFDFEADNAR